MPDTRSNTECECCGSDASDVLTLLFALKLVSNPPDYRLMSCFTGRLSDSGVRQDSGAQRRRIASSLHNYYGLAPGDTDTNHLSGKDTNRRRDDLILP